GLQLCEGLDREAPRVPGPAGLKARAAAPVQCAARPPAPRMRLNKFISDTGACSRREADRLIAEGRVQVNGLRARIGAEVGEGDTVLLDDQPLKPRVATAPGKRRHVYIALNKPAGITCT